MIADPDLYVLFLDCHRTFEYVDGKLFRRVRTSNRINPGDPAGYPNMYGYLLVRLNNMTHRLHRLIFLMCHGYLPEQVDHINGVKDDNRIDNLRAATASQNKHNVSLISTNSSGFKGVHWNKSVGKWRAGCCFKNKYVHLGYFESIEDANIAAINGREKYHGEFANHG